MSRYIDVSDLNIPSDENDYDELVAFADKVAEMITDAPSIDIVFCKECKWGEVVRNHSIGFCENQCGVRSAITESSYCSYGEREGE